MREKGRASWEIVTYEPEPLAIGLFVRDVAGLVSRHAWLPHCAPQVARAGEGSPEAAHQWDLWWDRSMSDNWGGPGHSHEQVAAKWWIPPDFESLHAAAALQEVVARHFDDALQWARDRKAEHISLMIGQPDAGPGPHRAKGGRGAQESRLVAGLEKNLGRSAQPFRLRITVIPVAGKELWEFNQHHVLVTDELLNDPVEYRQRIVPILQALV